MRYKRIKKFSYEIEDAVLTASEKEAARMAFDFDRRWLTLFWGIIILVACILCARVFYLTVIKGNYYAFVASGNSVRSLPIIAPRGAIYDHTGELLADNMPSRDIVIVTSLFPAMEGMQNAMKEILTTHVQIDRSLVDSAFDLAKNAQGDVTIVENITHEQALNLKAHERSLPGIRIQQKALRHYIDGEKFAHIIGYEGLIKKEEREQNPTYLLNDRIGKTGVEYTYEKYLHGIHGAEKMLVDSRGNVVKDLIDEQPQGGYDVHLNIDAQLQRAVYDRLSKELDRAKTRRATAVVIDPRDGAVRALVSLPSFDNNVFAQGIDRHKYAEWIADEDRPLFNRAIGGAYAPGSTVKPVMAVATLMEKIVSPDHQIESRGGLQLGSFFFGDWRVHGFTDIKRAIAVSSDVYFYTVGGGYGDIVGLGIERMKKYMTAFGYGEKTGIDLPGEVRGLYPDKMWKEEKIGEKWYIGNTYHASIGQGFITATALQVAQSITAIANGGTLYEPHVVHHVHNVHTNDHIDIAPRVIAKDLADENVIDIVQTGMRQTVLDGTATMLKDLPVAVAGKTGTAQFGTGEEVHSWFVSYAPYDDPEMVMVVMVEGQTGEISSTTVPVSYDIYKWYYGGKEGNILEQKIQENITVSEEIPVRASVGE